VAGEANIIFCDGHVESPPLPFLVTDTSTAALSRWNRDHHPTANACLGDASERGIYAASMHESKVAGYLPRLAAMDVEAG
jgi:prepilin-type processing-associated H-X9-DG protein